MTFNTPQMRKKSILFWSLLIFNEFHWFFIACHWFSIPNPSKTLQNHWKCFKICTKSCKMIKQTHNFHQNQHLLHYECKNTPFYIDFHWFSLLFIDFHWFSLIFQPHPSPRWKCISIFLGQKWSKIQEQNPNKKKNSLQFSPGIKK